MPHIPLMAKASRAKAAGTGISKADAMAFHFGIETEELAYLEPLALSRGILAFREGSPVCESCGCEVCTGRVNGEETDEEAARMARPGWKRATIVNRILRCSGCGKAYEVVECGRISADEAERLGL